MIIDMKRTDARKAGCRKKINIHPVTYKGQTKCIAEWAEILGFKYSTLQTRIVNRKWSIDRAFTQPLQKKCNTEQNN